MITKFDSSYVGSVDLENPGYLGTPINDRHYPNEVLADTLHIRPRGANRLRRAARARGSGSNVRRSAAGARHPGLWSHVARAGPEAPEV